MRYAHMIRRRSLIRAIAAVCIVLVGGMSAWLMQPKSQASADYTPTTLLLVHGFDDSCQYAFDKIGNANGGPSPTTTLSFLENNGWSNNAAWNKIDQIGYYDPSTPIYGVDSGGNKYTTYDSTSSDNPAGTCDHNIAITKDANNNPVLTPYAQNCATLYPNLNTGNYYFLDDPIPHLACMLAWYIYDTYTQNHIAVDILAHSMGGLIVRDALGEAQSTNASFPPGKLDVSRVVTVATPHGGESGWYLDQAKGFTDPQGQVVQEVQDMDPTSTGDGFMQHLFGPQFQAPQGANGTYWALMAGSNECTTATGTGEINCQVNTSGENGPWPDGDGVVQADSALSMAANFKILYGAGCYNCNTPTVVPFSADVLTQYSHEANSCAPWPLLGFITGCLSNPFYLNDGTPSSQTTLAWTCSSSCSAGSTGSGGINDLKVVVNGQVQPTRSVPHSLAEILSLLPAPSPPPPPTPTPTAVTTCSATNETDNIEPGGTYTDNRGNIWHVYYDIKRDVTTNKPCQMRVVVRIFNPAPDGAWHGTTGVFALVNGGYNGNSFGKISSSGTYQAHFVWRGPWFTVGPDAATYHIEDTEYNGSTPYLRAYANFSV